MALSDYVEGAEIQQPTENVVEEADQQIVDAQARASKRERIAALRAKRDNLVAQNAELRKKAQSFSDISNDEIFRMGQVKGIKAEDLNNFINARTSERNYEISKNNAAVIEADRAASRDAADATKAQNKILADNAKKKEIADKRAEILNLEKKLTDVVNTPVTEEKREVAQADFNLYSDQYNNAIQEYKDLSGKDWSKRTFVFKGGKAPAPAVPAENTETPLPEGFDKWDEADKTKYTRPETEATEKAAIEAKYKQKAVNKGKAETARQDRINENTTAGKAATSYLSAKSYALKLAKDLKGKTFMSILEDWGWDNNTKQKRAK